MAANELEIKRWLVGLHALEEQALVQLRVARSIVDEPALAWDLASHLAETERHRATVSRLLSGVGGSRSWVQDLGATTNRLGFLVYTSVGPDSAGKLLVDSIAYEQLEIAAYRMLGHAASAAGQDELARHALAIRTDEQAMAARLATWFDWAVAESTRRRRGGARAELVRHLRYVHALATQGEVLFALAGRSLPGATLRAYAFKQRQAMRDQRARLRARLEELSGCPSWTRSLAMGTAGAAWSLAWTVQPDAGAKLTCFLFAERHLQVSALELLAREARGAGDEPTQLLAEALLREAHSAASGLEALLLSANHADHALHPDLGTFRN